jgi:hypothetical protein
MFEQLKKILKIKFEGELTLKDGTEIILDAAGIKEGVGIFVKNADNKLMELPEGNYELSNNMFIIVTPDGVIKDVVDELVNKPTPDPIDNNPWAHAHNHLRPGVDVTSDLQAEINTEVLSPTAVENSGTTKQVTKKELVTMTPEELQKMLQDFDARLKTLEDAVAALQQAATPADATPPDNTADSTQMAIEKLTKDIEEIKNKAIFAKELPKVEPEKTQDKDSRIEFLKNYRKK